MEATSEKGEKKWRYLEKSTKKSVNKFYWDCGVQISFFAVVSDTVSGPIAAI